MSWRFIFLLIVLYFLYRSLKSIFFPAKKKGKPRTSGKGDETFYKNITDQKIEDIEFEEVDREEEK